MFKEEDLIELTQDFIQIVNQYQEFSHYLLCLLYYLFWLFYVTLEFCH